MSGAQPVDRERFSVDRSREITCQICIHKCLNDRFTPPRVLQTAKSSHTSLLDLHGAF